MLRRVGGWLIVWAVGMGTYLLFVVTLAPEELAVGALAAALATLAIAVVHRHEPIALDWSAAARWLAGTWRLPLRVVVDTVRLTRALWRQFARGEPVRGRFRTVPFPEDEPAATATARRVLVTTVASLAPNAYVVGIEDGRALVHELLPGDADPIPPALLRPGGPRPGRL
jgi:hypothetical protein